MHVCFSSSFGHLTHKRSINRTKSHRTKCLPDKISLVEVSHPNCPSTFYLYQILFILFCQYSGTRKEHRVLKANLSGFSPVSKLNAPNSIIWAWLACAFNAGCIFKRWIFYAWLHCSSSLFYAETVYVSRRLVIFQKPFSRSIIELI